MSVIDSSTDEAFFLAYSAASLLAYKAFASAACLAFLSASFFSAAAFKAI
jgi:hypothetical protein